MNLWRELNQKEEQEFRDSARKNYKPLTEISGVWHPVYQDECVKINKENSEVAMEPFTTQDLFDAMNGNICSITHGLSHGNANHLKGGTLL